MFRADAFLDGKSAADAGPLWADTTTEMMRGWADRRMPFSQIHGRSSFTAWRRDGTGLPQPGIDAPVTASRPNFSLRTNWRHSFRRGIRSCGVRSLLMRQSFGSPARGAGLLIILRRAVAFVVEIAVRTIRARVSPALTTVAGVPATPSRIGRHRRQRGCNAEVCVNRRPMCGGCGREMRALA